MHGSPACLPGPRLLYYPQGPRSPSSLSAAVTSGTGRAALLAPENGLVSRFFALGGLICARRAAAVPGPPRARQGRKKGRRSPRRPSLKLSDNLRPIAGPSRLKMPRFPHKQRVFSPSPVLSRLIPSFSNTLSPYNGPAFSLPVPGNDSFGRDDCKL